MPFAEILAILLVAAVIAALLAGYPVALTLPASRSLSPSPAISPAPWGSAFSARCPTASSAS